MVSFSWNNSIIKKIISQLHTTSSLHLLNFVKFKNNSQSHDIDKFFSFENIKLVDDRIIKNVYLYEWVGYKYNPYYLNRYDNERHYEKLLNKLSESNKLYLMTILYHDKQFTLVNSDEPYFIELHNGKIEDDEDNEDDEDDVIIGIYPYIDKTLKFEFII